MFDLTAIEKTYFTGTWTTAAQAMANMIHYTDKKHLNLVHVMGYTGLAFMINIHEETVDIAGPTASFDWGSTFARGMNNLGFKCKSVGTITSPPVAPTLEEVEAGLALAQKSIDRGIPVMAWDLFVPEFGVIYGYDDDAQTLRCKDVVNDGDLPYTKLGHGRIGELFVFAIDSSFEANKNDSLRDALALIIDHARIPITRLDGQPYRNGIGGYEAWKKAFEARTVDDIGNAYNAGVVSDAREYAAEFLRRVSAEWKEAPDFGSELSELSLAASEHYQKAANSLVKLREMFPFPQGGEPNKPEHAEMAISLLETAHVEEEQGVQKLERMLAVMEETSGNSSTRASNKSYPAKRRSFN